MRTGGSWRLAGLVAALVSMHSPLEAQTNVHFGPLGGVAWADFHGADAGATTSRTGLVLGAFVRVGLSAPLVIEPQLLYVQKGAESDPGNGSSSTFKLDYLEIPVLIKAAFPVASDTRIVPSIFGGPAVAFKVGCNIKATSGGASAEQKCSDAGVNVKGTDFSFVLGAGSSARCAWPLLARDEISNLRA